MTTISNSVWLIPPGLILAGVLGAAVISAVLTQLAIRGGPIDRPRERGSHKQPTPTSGGLAVMAATALLSGLILFIWGPQIPGSGRDGLLLFGFAGLMGLSGAVDDLIGLSARLRLGFQIIACLIFAFFYRVTELDLGFGLTIDLWPPIGLIGSAAWLLLGMNSINFMDGSNGLALGAQTLALSAICGLVLLMAPSSLLGAYLGVPLLICACAMGAHAGLLPFNLPLGKVFQGDAGALFSGALITGATLMLKVYGLGSVWFGGFVLAPLLVDVVLTLITRAIQRKNVLQAHREHLYQLWLQRRDPSHARLALWMWGLCAASSAVGFAARMLDHYQHIDVRLPCLAALIAAMSYGWLKIRRSLVQKPAEPDKAA